jgi:hypothetical protein
MTSPDQHRSGRREGAEAIVVALFVLLWPWAAPPGGPLWDAASRSFHGLLFAGLAWIWGRALPIRWRAAPLWAGLILLAALVEIVQPWLGRTGEWADWACSAAGAGVVCASWQWWRKAWARLMIVAVVSASPLLWTGYWVFQEARAFPVLAAADAYWSGTGWRLNAVKLQKDSEHGLRVVWQEAEGAADTMAYPGLFRTPARSDWRGAQGLRITLHWPAEQPAILAIRVDDRPGNPAYADRFQREFTVTQGWNRVWIAGGDLMRTTGGRPMEMDRIRQWGVFLVSAPAFDYFSWGEVRLELP